METGWFGQGVLLRLGAERADVVVVVEEQREQDAHGQRDEDPFCFEVPEVDQPAAVDGRVESARVRDAQEFCVFDAAGDVREAGPEDGGDGVGVV